MEIASSGGWARLRLLPLLVVAACHAPSSLSTADGGAGAADLALGASAPDAAADSSAADASALTDASAPTDASATSCTAAGVDGMGGDGGWLSGAHATQLDPTFASARPTVVVAADEQHVALTGNPAASSCLTGSVGPLVVETIGGDGCASAVTLAGHIYNGAIAFSADSQHLVFRDDDAPCEHGTLELADASGHAVKSIAAGVTNTWMTGQFVLFLTPADLGETLSVVSFADGSVRTLGSLAPVTPGVSNRVYVSPDGTHVAFKDAGAVLRLAALDGSTPVVTLPTTSDYRFQLAWARDGSRLAYGKGGLPQTLTLVAADGSGASDLTTDFYGGSVAFSPDGTLLGWDVGDSASQYLDVDVRRLSDGATFVYPTIYGSEDGCAAWGQIFFSPDSSTVFADNSIACAVDESHLSWGVVGTNGFTGKLLDNAHAFSFTRDGKLVAFTYGNDDGVETLALGGGSGGPVLPDPVGGPDYEHAAPWRLLTTTATFGLQLVDADGAGNPLVPPGKPNSNSARWIGRHVVYDADAQYDANEKYVDSTLRAVSDDGAAAGALATFEVGWGVAPRDPPSRVFVVRDALAGSGSGGLWSVTLP